MAAASRDSIQPRTFFLNERHELAPGDKAGGGRLPQYVNVPWARKAVQISASINHVLETVKASHDPLRQDRYFVLAQPVPEVEKLSKDKKKAPSGIFKEPTMFGDAHGRVFERLGLDLLEVTEDGQAVVHAERGRVEQLFERSRSLESLGPREQSRWATIEKFETIPLELRVDADWLQGLPQQPSDIIIELQPVLNRVEADTVLRAIADLFARQQGNKILGSGTDFSGRYWFRGAATRNAVRTLARDFFSVQAIHSPLYSLAAAQGRSRGRPVTVRSSEIEAPLNALSLPCVAVIDLGIAADHRQLGSYRRGQFIAPDAPRSSIGDHGAFVASRIVFGDCQSITDLSRCQGTCSFYDANVGDYFSLGGSIDRIDDKLVMPAITGVQGAAPDVRVFNLSFGDARPLNDFDEVERREKRLLMQDLDNFVFANDAIVVVAAGNSVRGVVPNPEYPGHYEDNRWSLGPWACGFNTLVCGSFVNRVSSGGLVQRSGWPSPFSRIGPGLCAAPIPSFCAEGGNIDSGFGFQSGLGVWGYTNSGMIEDRSGTSHAAPLLAREAALTLNDLKDHCEGGTQPFGVTVRAFLALVAEKTTTDSQVETLANRTLGFGKTSSLRIKSPRVGSAVILWQGIINAPGDIVRVQMPIPQEWLKTAETPFLRLFVCYSPPVNAAGSALWACRRVRPVLHARPDGPAIRAPAGGHETYPLIHREYNLTRHKPGDANGPNTDFWLLELSYEETFSNPPGMVFDSRQRVAFAAELVDKSEAPVDPQATIQTLPLAATMNRLSIQSTPVRTPAIIRTRGA